MPKITNEEIKTVDDKLKYIGLNIKEIPNFFKNNKVKECILSKEYRDTTCKVYKYVDVNDIQIFITSAKTLEKIENKCKNTKSIYEYIRDELLCNKFLQMVENINIEDLMELENEQNRFDISYPYNISYKNSFKWHVFYCEASKKYMMLVSSNEKASEAMFLLLKKQIQSNKDNVTIKIYIPIINEGYSEKFLTNSQITDIENYLWFFTKRWPSVYEVVDIYGNRSMHIIGKTLIYENIESYYKIVLKDKKVAIEKYELLKELFLISSNLREEYKFEIKINESGMFQIFFKEQEISLNKMEQFLNEQVEEKIDRVHEIIEKIESLENELVQKKQELDTVNEEYNQKQKQIVTFLQCKRTFLGRFKYFFKSNKKHKRINKIFQVQKVELLKDDEVNDEVYNRKEFYYIEDLLAVCNILSKKSDMYKANKKEFKSITEKIEILKQKIKNADLFINEIESHKHSIFEFWKFTNKDLPNELTEAEKLPNDKKNNPQESFNFLRDIENLEKEMDNMQLDKLSKNEMDAIFIVKDYINVLDILCKKEIQKEEEEYIKQVLENEKQEFENQKKNQNVIYFDSTQNMNLHIKEERKNLKKDKYKILNFGSDIKIEDFKNQLLKTKKILEKAYNKIKIPYNIPVYSILQNNQMYEWSLASLDLQEEIKKQEDINIDIIKYNIPKESSMLFYTNHVIYSNNENVKYGMDKEKQVLLYLNNFELSLKGKIRERISLQKNDNENVIKTIKIYEYDLKQKENKENEL